jgi:hypothetical protein
MPVLAWIDLDRKDGQGSLHLDTIILDPLFMLIDCPYIKMSKSRDVSTHYMEKPTRLKPSQSVVVLLTPSHLLMFACPISGTIFLLAFQPRGRSETPLYKENSRGLSISYTEFVSDGACLLFLEPLRCEDDVLGGGDEAGAVVTEVAKDKARDRLVFLLSGMMQDICPSLLLFVCCVTRANMGDLQWKV